MEQRPAGQLFDIGYQRYDGPRQGRRRAWIALLTNGFRQTLGLGQGARSKILPALMVAASVVPAGVILVATVIASAFDPSADSFDRPAEVGDYLSGVTTLLLILTAMLAPALLVSDRRDNVLSLYLVRPLGMLDYLIGRWLAFFLVTAVIVFMGPFILMAGYTLLSPDAVQVFRDNWRDLVNILAASVIVAAFLTTIPMGVAAFTPRRVYAAAIVIGASLVLFTVVGALISLESCEDNAVTRPMTAEERAEAQAYLAAVDESGIVQPGQQPPPHISFGVGEVGPETTYRQEVQRALDAGEVQEVTFECAALVPADVGEWLVFADPFSVVTLTTDMLFTDVEPQAFRELAARHPDWYPVAAYLAWLLVPLALMWWQYRRYAA